MRFKGKIDVWFWIVMLFGEALVIGALLTPEDGILMGIVVTIFYNVIFLPFVFRNYVEITEDKVTVAFGFGKDSMAVSEIQEVHGTHNPIASSAASLDRIVIKGHRKEMMCAVQDKEKFFICLKEKNPDIDVSYNVKAKATNTVTKGSVIFCLIIFAVVGVLLMTGDIKIEYGTDSFTIKASYWYDKEIDYADIECITYCDEKVNGSRTGGFRSFRLLMGDFKNDELGNYTRYTYADCDAGVVLLVNGREVVISGEDEVGTREIYEELLERCEMYL